jgi:hypothetical protein
MLRALRYECKGKAIDQLWPMNNQPQQQQQHSALPQENGWRSWAAFSQGITYFLMQESTQEISEKSIIFQASLVTLHEIDSTGMKMRHISLRQCPPYQSGRVGGEYSSSSLSSEATKRFTSTMNVTKTTSTGRVNNELVDLGENRMII